MGYGNIKKKKVNGRPRLSIEQPSRERKIRHIRMSDDEWEFAAENARQCHMPTSSYIRKLASGYRPIVFDKELVDGIHLCRRDLVNFSKHLKGLSAETRAVLLRDPATHAIWAGGIENVINFLTKLEGRLI